MMSLSKEKAWDYFILVARVLLGWTFLRYGYGKLVDGQFGITEQELNTPVKDLSLFRLFWYLMDHEPAKSFVGIFQIISGALLIYNRTVILGALLFLPLVVNILIFDITFLKMTAFYWRLSFYIILDFLILWHYKERMFIVWNAVTNNITTKFKYPFWTYLILPVLAIGLEILPGLPKVIYYFIVDPIGTIEAFKNLFIAVIEAL
jgi:uncharacterized membrane protein YphA (DoxX/SURF4 family)